MKILFVFLTAAIPFVIQGGEPETLFDGSNLDAWEYPEGSWSIGEDGSIACHMEEVKGKGGETKLKGKGYIWTKKEYGDFELTLQYKLSEGANSGVFYRSTKDDPVHQGFEIQLMDNEGFQKTHGEKEDRKLNGSFYDAHSPAPHQVNPPGSWNTLRLRCEGPIVQCWINEEQTFGVDVTKWTEVGKNPDGTTNKFKTAIKDKPKKGFVGLQNHGQYVWFKDIVITPL